METDLAWKAFDAVAPEARPHTSRLEKLAYRAPGTTSVPAQPEVPANDAGRAAAAGAEQAAAMARLEARFRAAESASAARAELLRRESREALEEVRRSADRQIEEALASGAQQLGAALQSFQLEREEYFAKVEREVVRLALAIAARILHREALLDPLLLAGAVRVALGQLGETTGVRLRCPVEQVERWQAILRRLPSPALAPEVAGDEELGAGDCVIEARIGTVDLGVRAQLEEIERGFFDLLEQRSGTGARRGPETSL